MTDPVRLSEAIPEAVEVLEAAWLEAGLAWSVEAERPSGQLSFEAGEGS